MANSGQRRVHVPLLQDALSINQQDVLLGRHVKEVIRDCLLLRYSLLDTEERCMRAESYLESFLPKRVPELERVAWCVVVWSREAWRVHAFPTWKDLSVYIHMVYMQLIATGRRDAEVRAYRRAFQQLRGL